MSIDFSDQDLLSRVRNGDTTAFGDLYAHHTAAAHRAARRIVRDPHLAQDLVSESFARVFKALRTANGPQGDLFPYLLVTMRNVAATWGRDSSRYTPVGDDLLFQPRDARDHVGGADEAPVDSLNMSLTSSAFTTLPVRWRTVLWYLEVEGESASEVGARIGLSEVAVRQLAKRAREGLREAYLAAYLGGAPMVGAHVPTADLVRMARGKISLHRRRTVEPHLDTCAQCTRLLFEAAEENSTLRALALPFYLAAAYAAAKYAHGVRARLTSHGKQGTRLSAAGAAAAVLIAILVGAFVVPKIGSNRSRAGSDVVANQGPGNSGSGGPGSGGSGSGGSGSGGSGSGGTGGSGGSGSGTGSGGLSASGGSGSGTGSGSPRGSGSLTASPTTGIALGSIGPVSVTPPINQVPSSNVPFVVPGTTALVPKSSAHPPSAGSSVTPTRKRSVTTLGSSVTRTTDPAITASRSSATGKAPTNTPVTTSSVPSTTTAKPKPTPTPTKTTPTTPTPTRTTPTKPTPTKPTPTRPPPTGTITPSPTPPAPPATQITNSGLCISAPTVLSGQLTLGICILGLDLQSWTLASDGTLRLAGGYCMTATTSTTVGGNTSVQAVRCAGGKDQQWTRGANQSLRNAQGGERCLDAEFGIVAVGTRLIAYQCTGGLNQRWNFSS